MLVAHEPARLVGADRQDGELERSVALAGAAKQPAVAVAGIGDDIDSSDWRVDHERRPQRHVAIRQVARRPMACRNQRHRRGAEIDAVIPIESFGRDRGIMIAHDRVIAERRDDPRAMRGGEPRQRRDIEMIVVGVRHQHDVDRRQVGEGDAGIVDPFRPDVAERRRALRPDRVEQDIETGGLDQPTGVADIGDAAGRTFDARRRTVGKRRRRPVRPFCLGAAQPALQEPAQADRAGSAAVPLAVEKALTVEMIGDRAVVIARHSEPDI